VQRALVLRRYRPRFVEKQPTGIRKRGLALRSNEDRAAKLPFEFLYLLRQRRLRHPEARRSTAEVQLFGDRDEVTEPSEIDTHMTDILIEHVMPIGHM
jgi:hypothetical protein